ncbi:hypothetical protein CesoFtcFv8_004747 [Champsocephalus esox]|uniref:BESS domain-containing protein n=1 Tax=Champsocephalus esox TaxID=159716 RepID=A0AAN8CTR7_9TELE|nr:hypothetical protein CesoFtcFv8_004747 [Champsocephalus esox]
MRGVSLDISRLEQRAQYVNSPYRIEDIRLQRKCARVRVQVGASMYESSPSHGGGRGNLRVRVQVILCENSRVQVRVASISARVRVKSRVPKIGTQVRLESKSRTRVLHLCTSSNPTTSNPTTSGERQRPSRSRSPRDPISAAAAQRSTRDQRRRPQSTDLGEQLLSLLQEPPAKAHMPDSELEESYHFTLSLVPILQRLDKDRRHQAKLSILNTLHNLENTQHLHWQPIVHPPMSQHSIHTSRPVAFRPSVPQPPQGPSTPIGPLTQMLSSPGWQDSQPGGSYYEEL